LLACLLCRFSDDLGGFQEAAIVGKAADHDGGGIALSEQGLQSWRIAPKEGLRSLKFLLRGGFSQKRLLQWAEMKTVHFVHPLFPLPGAEPLSAFATTQSEAGSRSVADSFPPLTDGLVDENKSGGLFAPLATLLGSVSAEPEWLLEGYVALGAVTLLAGLPKAGKSTFLFSVLNAIVGGDPLVGLGTEKAGVLLLSEEHQVTLKEKASRVGLDLARVHGLHRQHGGLPSWPQLVDEAINYCKTNGLRLLVVDTLRHLARLRDDDENRAGKVMEAITPLLSASRDHGLAVVVVHHERKAGGEYGVGVAGSNALAGAVDIVIQLERARANLSGSGNTRMLKTVSRFPSTPTELIVELHDGSYKRRQRPELEAEGKRADILAALAELGESTQAMLAEATGLPRGTLSTHLKALEAQGGIVTGGAGKRGDPRRYRLPNLVSSTENSSSRETDSAAARQEGRCDR
jgi:DNA-binding transcriptional ArsR family regulator